MSVSYRKSFEVVGYTFFCDIYCADCGAALPEVDPEGNAKQPIFLDGLWEFEPEHNEGQTYHCAKCEEQTTNW